MIPSPPTGSPTTAPSTPSTTTRSCSSGPGSTVATARPGATGNGRRRGVRVGRRRAGDPGRAAGRHRLRRRALGRVRLGCGGRLRGAPVHRDVLVDLRTRPLQEDGPHLQRGLDPRRAARALPHRRRARDGGRVPDLRPGQPRPGPGLGDHERDGRACPTGQCRVLFTPWLNGERSPVDDHTLRGVSTTCPWRPPGAAGPAVFEGVALNSRWLLEAVEKFAGRQLDSLAFVGEGPTPAPGRRSTPTCSAGRSARWPTRCWPTCGARVC